MKCSDDGLLAKDSQLFILGDILQQNDLIYKSWDVEIQINVSTINQKIWNELHS